MAKRVNLVNKAFRLIVTCSYVENVTASAHAMAATEFAELSVVDAASV